MKNKLIGIGIAMCIQFTVLGQSMNPELGGYENIDIDQAYKMVTKSSDVWLIDVRTSGEFADSARSKSLNIGKLKGSINMPLQTFEEHFEAAGVPVDAKIILACSHSNRSRIAATYLKGLGYENVYNILGGLARWNAYEKKAFKKKDDFIERPTKMKFLSPRMICDLDGSTVFIDTRRKEVLQDEPKDKGTVLGKFKNAINVPVKEFDEYADRLPSDKATPVLVYDYYSRAVEVGHRLLAAGYTDVSVLAGGINSFILYKPKCYERLFVEEETDYETITPQEFCSISASDYMLLDIRETGTFEMSASKKHRNDGYLEGAVNIPLSELSERSDELDASKRVIVYGTNWIDAGKGADILVREGFKNVYRMGGGMREWYNLSLKNLECRDKIGRNLR